MLRTRASREKTDFTGYVCILTSVKSIQTKVYINRMLNFSSFDGVLEISKAFSIYFRSGRF